MNLVLYVIILYNFICCIYYCVCVCVCVSVRVRDSVCVCTCKCCEPKQFLSHNRLTGNK